MPAFTLAPIEVVEMTKTPGSPPLILADDPALDFLNTIAAPSGRMIEWIGDGDDLLRWLKLTGLVPADSIEELRAASSPKDLDETAAHARRLREWFRDLVATRAAYGEAALKGGDLSPINDLLVRDDVYFRIEKRRAAPGARDEPGSVFHWAQIRHWRSPGALLHPIARAMGDLICLGDISRVKQCAGPTCTLWFRDTSLNGTRRWCSMAICGNRAKAAAHRAKKKERTQAAGGK